MEAIMVSFSLLLRTDFILIKQAAQRNIPSFAHVFSISASFGCAA